MHTCHAIIITRRSQPLNHFRVPVSALPSTGASSQDAALAETSRRPLTRTAGRTVSQIHETIPNVSGHVLEAAPRGTSRVTSGSMLPTCQSHFREELPESLPELPESLPCHRVAPATMLAIPHPHPDAKTGRAPLGLRQARRWMSPPARKAHRA